MNPRQSEADDMRDDPARALQRQLSQTESNLHAVLERHPRRCPYLFARST